MFFKLIKMKELLQHIKSSRISKEDKFMIDTFSNLQIIRNIGNNYYYNNGEIIMRYNIKNNTIFYGLNKFEKTLESFNLTPHGIECIMNKYLKIYLDLENTYPWRCPESKWVYNEIIKNKI